MKGSKTCMSGLTPSTVMSISEIEEITGVIPNHDPKIVHPSKYANKSFTQYLKEKDDWDMKLIKKSQHLLKYSKQRLTCYWLKTPEDTELDHLIGYPDLKNVYKPPQIECQRPGTRTKDHRPKRPTGQNADRNTRPTPKSPISVRPTPPWPMTIRLIPPWAILPG